MKAVLFDLDGVITDTADYHYFAWKTLAEEIGISIDRLFNEQLKGVSRVDSLERILTYGNQANRFSSTEKKHLAQRKNEIYLEQIKKITPADLLPGIPTLITALREKRYKIGLVSASKNGRSILALLGIKHVFDVIVDPDSVPTGKPDPAIFLKAAELLQIVPSECVGVEDANAGITAINAANMVSVGIGDAQQLAHSDRLFASTQELSVEKLEYAWNRFHQ